MSGKEYSLEELLVVEDDPSVTDFRCSKTGTLLWPQIRFVFLSMIMSDLLYGTPLVNTAGIDFPRKKAALNLSRSLLHNARLRITNQCHADICIMAEGIGNLLRDGKWFNRFSDYFAMCGPSQTLVVEDHHGWHWPFPRHFQKVLLHAPQQARHATIGRLLVHDAHLRHAGKLIKLVSQRAQSYLNWHPGAQREQQLVHMLAKKMAALPHQYRGYKAMLKHIGPRLLLINAACYGPSAVLIAVARDMGIVTAEYQHGMISAGHVAYNLAPCLQGSDAYRHTLPEYFLGYGQWWNEQIDVPVSKIVIGNPHRETQLAQISSTARAGRDVLVLGDGIDTDLYIDLARQLVTTAKKRGLRVVFRPHPIERLRVASKYQSSADNVVIDQNPDIYHSLVSAHAVVSEISTSLFEAIGLAERIFIWNTPKARFSLPIHPFQGFASVSELVEMLNQDQPGLVPAPDPNAIWAPHWQNNYLEFVQAHGVMTHEAALAT